LDQGGSIIGPAQGDGPVGSSFVLAFIAIGPRP
jgi:hypothetical protein